MPAAPMPDCAESIVLGWVDAFNRRDLDGVLERMRFSVTLHPLRLHGLERTYSGHDGVQRWFAHIEELGFEHRIFVSDLSVEGSNVTAHGDLLLTPQADPVGIWMLERIESGLIVSAHHYLTDPGAFPRPASSELLHG